MKHVFQFLSVTLLLSIILSSCADGAPATVVVTVEVEGQLETVVVTATPEDDVEPVTLYGYSTSDIPTLDPQLGEDVLSINWIENLFVQLTNVDLATNEVVPEAATQWATSEDGLTYTFTLRTDIPWVKYNPVSGETTQEVNEQGQPRFVTAHDFEYGIKRACDPDTGSYYSSVVAPQIKGCAEVLFAEEVTPELLDDIGVNAVDDSTLVIELEFPASYFLTMTPMWTLAATPQWAIEEHGEDWIEAGNIVTNGRYMLAEWVHNVRRIALRNPFLPSDLHGSGNIERVLINLVPDQSTGYALWLAGEVDGAYIPDQEIEAHLENFPDEAEQVGDLSVLYVAFRMTKSPFDDVHVRRAFSAAIDRQLYIDSVLQGQGLPMKHFAPPGIFGAPPIDEVGVGFDPEHARAQFEQAGYSDCEGFPLVTLMTWPGEGGRADAEFFIGQWQQNLGCTDDQFSIEQLPFAEMLAATAMETPDELAPHMWTLGWAPDYADENNWVGDVLWCKTASRSKRTCNEIDEMIVEAREEINPGKRIALYRQIEQAFFGAEGEFPFAPIFLSIRFYAVHSWYDWKPGLFGGAQWYNDSIDQQAQLAARDQ